MKRITSLRDIILIIFIMIGFSCKKDVPSYFLKVETSDGKEVADILSVGSDGLTQSFVVKSNGSWKIFPTGSDISWLSVHPDFGKEDGSFSLVVNANTSPLTRKAQLSFTLNGKETMILQIVQESFTPDESENSVSPFLDVVFKADGTAQDISPEKHNISTLDGSGMTTLYSETYQRYIAQFNHAPGGADMSAGFYKIDYSFNQAFKDALSDGHTMEAVFMLDFESPLPNEELKMFSSHEGGGTGLIVGNNANNNAIIFLPSVGSGYAWTNSGIVPERGKYYHVVGVWNKSEGKSYIYVNGILKATVNALGSFNFPKAGSTWFGIGADPSKGTFANSGWKGDVAVARIYDKPLDGEEVAKLWKQIEGFKPAPGETGFSGVSLTSKKVQLNADYVIKGKGFVSGDKIKMTPLSGSGPEFTCEGTVIGDSFTIKIPTNFSSGRYRFFVVRGGKPIDIGFATLTVVDNIVTKTQVVAHRGYWKTGASQNSIASLTRAQELGVYGSETDVHITADGVAVINHDASISGIKIETATYAQIKDIKLSNGEKLPTLKEYLVQVKKDLSTKLILEIKTHSGSVNGVKNNDRAATEVVNLITQANMTGQVEFIAFDLDVCKKLLQLLPNAMVGYLGGDIAPGALHVLGVKNIDYNISVIRKNLGWISQAHNLNMTVNVWTVNSEGDITEMIGLGVDYITTDYPVLVKQLVDSY